MIPATAIAALDRQLAAHGQAVTLRRLGSPNVEVSLLASVSDVEPASAGEDHLGGDIVQFDRKAVLSPTGLGSWPGALAQSDGTDIQVPRVHDQLVIAGRVHSVVSALPRYIGSTLVRIDLVVRG
jgi:hypothetical protein